MKTYEPILTDQRRPCDRCGIETYWRFSGQSKRGRCPDHFGAIMVDPATDVAAMTTLARTFPGLMLIDPPAPPTIARIRVRLVSVRGDAPWVRYVDGPAVDAGPCARCRRLAILYGPWGRPLCDECEANR